MSRRFFVAIYVFVLPLIVPALALACAVCGAGDNPADPVANAFNWSILFLMAAPYAVVGSIAGWFFYAYRKAARKRGLLKEKAPILRLASIPKESGR